MGDLISRSALIKAMEKKYDVAEKNAFYSVGLSEGFIITEEIIKEQPTVEAKPVVHGEWIEHKWAEEDGGYLISNFECSKCHTWERKKSDFCPECGADMRAKPELVVPIGKMMELIEKWKQELGIDQEQVEKAFFSEEGVKNE